jgi:UDP-glucose 4-epimerase
LLQLIATIEAIVGVTLEKTFASARAGDIRHSLGDGSHAHKLLGFKANTSLMDGLKDTLAWEAAHA